MIRRLTSRSIRERGAITLWVVIMAGAVLLTAGLMADVATKVQTQRQAQTVAQEAARAAAQQLDPSAIVGHTSQIDPVAGAAAARSYLRVVGVEGTVVVVGSDVQVTTTMPWAPRFVPVGGKIETGFATATSQRSKGA